MKKNNIEIHAVIPARSGSKGVKNKNIRKINNKELIGYTIETAKKIKLISKVIVSTDSQKIKKISEKFGAEVPFLRPLKFSKDSSTDLEVFKHYLSWLKKNKKKIPELILHLRATTPFRSKQKIIEAIKLMLRKKNASCLRSFKHSNFSPYKMWRYKNKHKHEVNPVLLYKKNLESHSLSRQKLPNTFNHIGIVDILRPKKTILQNSICGNVVVPLVFKSGDLKNYIDIDTKNDLKRARLIKLKIKEH
jgi:CMP-N,N'-diacetyllegionaminic acid synthase